MTSWLEQTLDRIMAEIPDEKTELDKRRSAYALSADYGIVANSMEADRVFRLGAKAWIAGGTGGEGWDKFEWIAHSRGSRVVRKWAPTQRFGNFRAAWVPEHLRERIWYIRGSRDEMEQTAAALNVHAAQLRAKMLNRRPSHHAVFPKPVDN